MPNVSKGTVLIGISGYDYKPWRGRFYPADLPARRWLEFASRTFDSIELNGTFYSLKSPAVFDRWVNEVPDEFVFAVKGGRFITHNLKLRNAEASLGNFFASGVLALGTTTGPYRHAFEVRHPTYFNDEFFSLLRAHGCGFVVADTAGKFPYAEEVTADFVYVRLHGSQQLYVSGYTDGELDAWTEKIPGGATAPAPHDWR